MHNLNTILNISKNIKLLYVEDDQTTRESTLGLLNNIFTDITLAIDGEEGLKKFSLANIKYDLIISDINIPNMNGKEMINTIQKVDDNIKIFILSAHNEIEPHGIDKVEAYLSKPIDLMKLLKEIENNF